jgi:hypothetical protein
VARKSVSAACRGCGELRLELGEDAELGVLGVGDVEVVLVAAAPEEGLPARDPLDVVGEDAAALRTSNCSAPKSSPTGPTGRTSVKKLAASEKCTAAPPSMRSALPERGLDRVERD